MGSSTKKRIDIKNPLSEIKMKKNKINCKKSGYVSRYIFWDRGVTKKVCHLK